MSTLNDLADFLSRPGPVARVELTRVKGSSPREAGTEMFVRGDALCGTIGGGQLEHRAIETARDMLRGNRETAQLDLPLGPEIGQCCGGRVELTITRMTADAKADAMGRGAARHDAFPSVYVLGAGHVGRELANLFQHLPVRCILVDQRAGELALNSARVETRTSAIPEAEITTAPPGSAFIVLTHDHGLDFLLASAALERGDAAYVGLIGSTTKRTRFRNWCRTNCDGLSIAPLICPIGAGGSRDKRPAVIAAMVVAEVVTALISETTAKSPERGAVPQIAAQ